jgi:dTDP-4-amino-4,6-dideoxygalactose transaminase
MALAACLAGVGVVAGDDVLTSALDWSSATAAIGLIGARPVYVDVDPRLGTLNPALVEDQLGPRVSAVVVTHLFGVPANVPDIRRRAGGVPVVEDCAQAVGASLGGRPVGTLGDAAAFSLGPGKHVDAGEGGIAVFADEYAWETAVVATQHHVRAAGINGRRQSPLLSSRIHPMAAVLALHELSTLPQRLAQRRGQAYDWARRNPSAQLLGVDEFRTPSFWRVPVLNATSTASTPLAPELALGTLARAPVAHATVGEIRLAAMPDRAPRDAGSVTVSRKHHV